jgi:hypothetical protein
MAPEGADDQVCAGCGEPVDPDAVRCPVCDRPLLAALDPEAVAARLDATNGDLETAPRWAVLLTGLALGIAIAPLVAYAVVIAVGGLSLPLLAAIALLGWLVPAAYLARLPNPSAALARGLYLVVGGVGAVLVAVVVDAGRGQSTVESNVLVLGVVALAVPAVLALVLARRVAARAARQARGEPGRLHELAGRAPNDRDQPDEPDS